MASIETNFTDIAIEGTTGSTGKATTLYNNDALNNAFRIWISSSGFDAVRTKRGGYVLKHIGKPMNSERARDIKRDIIIGLREDFKPDMNIIKVSVIPLYDIRTWRITVQAYSPSLQIGINNDFYLRNNR